MNVEVAEGRGSLVGGWVPAGVRREGVRPGDRCLKRRWLSRGYNCGRGRLREMGEEVPVLRHQGERKMLASPRLSQWEGARGCQRPGATASRFQE